MKILIVDDDPVSRELLKKHFSEFSECEFAENGVRALDVYKQGWENWAPFDLMTLDISMPDMDGKEVLQTIRTIENEKKVPRDKRAKILMTSGQADKQTILTCVRMGCDDYISKPFDKDTILKKIRKLGLYIPLDEKDEEVIKDNRSETQQELSEEDKKVLKENIQGVVHKFKTGKIQLPVLPKIIGDVRKVMGDPDSTIEDLAEVIEKDAVISIRIIAGANSPFYRGTEKITAIDKAIMRLGFQETGSIVNAIANKNLYNIRDATIQLSMEKMWLHSLASAHGARILAESQLLDNPESYFLMGLTHDIGMVLILKHLERISFLQDTSKINSIFPVLRRIHSDFGGAIIKRWGFPDRFVRVILQHEGPHFTPETEKDVLIANLAMNLAYRLGYGLVGVEVDLSKLDATRLLDIDPDSFDAICQEIKENVIGSSEVI
ncbi:MAG: HDOD domain-containing protein [Desulfobacteraceae bacterium]|jgi:HD-like signal output (HDOD) protein/DNA-binding NarL/FixJ family response regulator